MAQLRARTVVGLVVITSALGLLCTGAHGGAWLVQKDDWRVEFNNKYYWTDTDFDADGDQTSKPKGGKYTECRSELKVDFGFSDRLNLLFAVPAKWAKYEDDNSSQRTDGVGDIRFGAKYSFSDDPVASRVFSLQGMVKVPAGYDTGDSPPLGDGQTDLELRLLVGQSFLRESEAGNVSDTPEGSPRREATRDGAFLGLELGYRWRAGDPADEIVYLAQGGVHLARGVSVQAELDGVESLDFTGDEEDYHIWRTGLLYQSKGGASPIRFGRSLGLGIWYGMTYAGRSTSKGEEVIAKIFWEF